MIPPPNKPLIDNRGMIAPEWYRFLAGIERDLNKSGAAVADASGGATIDTQARAAINGLLGQLRTLGVIAT